MHATIHKHEKRIDEFKFSIRIARALADNVIHGEYDLAGMEDVHEVLSNALRFI